MSTIPSRSRFAIAAAVLASMTSTIVAVDEYVPYVPSFAYPDLATVYPLAECTGDCDDDEDCAVRMLLSRPLTILSMLNFHLLELVDITVWYIVFYLLFSNNTIVYLYHSLVYYFVYPQIFYRMAWYASLGMQVLLPTSPAAVGLQ